MIHSSCVIKDAEPSGVRRPNDPTLPFVILTGSGHGAKQRPWTCTCTEWGLIINKLFKQPCVDTQHPAVMDERVGCPGVPLAQMGLIPPLA